MKENKKGILQTVKEKFKSLINRGKKTDDETFLQGVKRRAMDAPVLTAVGTGLSTAALATAVITGAPVLLPAIVVGTWGFILAGGVDIALGAKSGPGAQARAQRSIDESTLIVFKLKNDTPASEIGASLKQVGGVKAVFNVKAADQGAAATLAYTANVLKGNDAEKAVKSISSLPNVEYARLAK